MAIQGINVRFIFGTVHSISSNILQCIRSNIIVTYVQNHRINYQYVRTKKILWHLQILFNVTNFISRFRTFSWTSNYKLNYLLIIVINFHVFYIWTLHIYTYYFYTFTGKAKKKCIYHNLFFIRSYVWFRFKNNVNLPYSI